MREQNSSIQEKTFCFSGEKSKESLQITELVIPPLAVHARRFANAPLYMLPMDFSIIGLVHSHPNGNLALSNVDFNHFFGRIMMIVGFPFISEDNVAIYDSKGEQLKLEITNK